MKANANFKLSKSAKRLIASEPNAEKANHMKRMFIQAELSAAVQPRVSKRKDTQGA